jgi:DNA-binding HxlR family transcriptional regulator
MVGSMMTPSFSWISRVAAAVSSASVLMSVFQSAASQGLASQAGIRYGAAIVVKGTHRFSELRRKVEGMSEKMLAQTLQALEADGFIRRKAYPVVPPRVDYSLTEMGREIAEQIEGLAGWIEENLSRVAQSRAKSRKGKETSS